MPRSIIRNKSNTAVIVVKGAYIKRMPHSLKDVDGLKENAVYEEKVCIDILELLLKLGIDPVKAKASPELLGLFHSTGQLMNVLPEELDAKSAQPV
jgi:hypothetical protein